MWLYMLKQRIFVWPMSGIKDTNSYTVTSAFGGVFLNDRETRKEFFKFNQ